MSEELGKLWEYRKSYVQKLFDAIDKDLVPTNWSVNDPENITIVVNFNELIDKMEGYYSNYEFKKASELSIRLLRFMSWKISDIVKPRLIEPFRIVINMLREDEIKMEEKEKEISQLKTEINFLNEKLRSQEEKFMVAKEKVENPEGYQNKIEEYRVELLQELEGKNYTDKRQLNGWYMGNKRKISEADEWKKKVLQEVKEEWLSTRMQ